MFWGPILGIPGGVTKKNFGRQNCVCSSATSRKKLISMFCGLEEERTRFRKRKKKFKKEILIASKSGLAKMKRYLKTYNYVKYFSP